MSNKEKFVKFISGKGFYAVLAVCLIGAGTAAWVAVDRTMDSIEKNNSQIIEENANSQQSSKSNWDNKSFENITETEKNEENIKKENSSKQSEEIKKETKSPVKKDESKTEIKPNPSTQLRPQKISYIMPIEGEIINAYSDGKLVKDVTLNEWRTHNGVDIKGEIGSSVVAVANGKITNITNDKVWGDIIEVTHNDGTTAYYCGAKIMDNIKTGDTVIQKQQIARLAKIPCEVALEPHLHFGMKKGEIWVDPLKQMNIKK